MKWTYDGDAFEAFHERVFEALWQDGRDAGDPAVVADIASSVGIPEDEVYDADPTLTTTRLPTVGTTGPQNALKNN